MLTLSMRWRIVKLQRTDCRKIKISVSYLLCFHGKLSQRIRAVQKKLHGIEKWRTNIGLKIAIIPPEVGERGEGRG